MKLNQILAIEKGIKNSTKEKISALHHRSTHAPLYDGIEKTYRPKDEEGDMLPSESQKIQLHASAVLTDASNTWSELFDITYSKDAANCEAKADVKVGETVVLPDVPVTYLLFLEKQLQDVLTFVSKLPVLDSSESWTWSDSQSCYETAPVETHRSTKISEPVVLYEATDKHPAQVKEAYKDVIVGYWKKIRYSAAISETEKNKYEKRVTDLLRAVKVAREAANSSTAVRSTNIGDKLFSHIFQD